MSDDDLIRRGDALAAVKAHDFRWEAADAIAALPARGVRVKPLVWKQEADNAWVAAHYAIHQYWPHNNGPFAVSGYLGGLGAMSLGKHPTLDAAKAAAQADYEARILAALEPAAHVNETLKSEHEETDVLTEYTLAPHLQKIVDGAKTTPQWDTQADRLAPTDAATQKGGDAHDRRLRSHEASPGLTAGADAAQAREAALREAHKAILAMDTKKDEDLTYNLAVLRAAEKVRRLIDEARPRSSNRVDYNPDGTPDAREAALLADIARGPMQGELMEPWINAMKDRAADILRAMEGRDG